MVLSASIICLIFGGAHLKEKKCKKKSLSFSVELLAIWISMESCEKKGKNV